jgi:hypothetical protein
MPVRINTVTGLSAPPPPDFEGAAAFSTDFADAVAESPLTEDVQVSVKVRVREAPAGA